MVNAHAADALVCISNCDKITPGMLLAALRLNIPTVFVSGGPMEAGSAVIGEDGLSLIHISMCIRDSVDRVHGLEELPALLAHHEVVVLIVPLTEQTSRLVDATFLATMPDGALLVNVARGSVVDTDALLAELNSGRLRAALDVTDPEPLPSGHPLWSAPGLLVTPHVGGVSRAFRPRALRLVREQLRRYAAGKPFANVVA